MRIIIYNSSSFGGCYDYGREIHRAYQQIESISAVEWWVPENAPEENLDGVRRLFITDKPAASMRILRQLHFLWRVLMNPLRLYQRLAASPPSCVILNDFEQLTAPIWAPLFRLAFYRKHVFSVILHDPDRDAYPPSLWWTKFSMKSLLKLCEIAFYHSYLPEKSYYTESEACQFLDLPHGVFHLPPPDAGFIERIRSMNPKGLHILCIPGNIRTEKNYHLAMEALVNLTDCALLIAGAASNARVDVPAYRQLASDLGVSNRVFWIEAYLNPAELAAVISASDVVLLNYAESFTSQSGIFNLTIPFGKPVVASSGKSGMTMAVESFGLGTLVKGLSVADLEEAVRSALRTARNEMNWRHYQEYASWSRHAILASGYFLLTLASRRR
jgi:glycosyltransferase involved in cell wall biosynthesis